MRPETKPMTFNEMFSKAASDEMRKHLIFSKTKELIGVIKAAEALATVDGKYEHPLLDSMLELSKEINGLIEKSSVGETL